MDPPPPKYFKNIVFWRYVCLSVTFKNVVYEWSLKGEATFVESLHDFDDMDPKEFTKEREGLEPVPVNQEQEIKGKFLYICF